MVRKRFEEHIEVIDALLKSDYIERVESVGKLIVDTLKNGNKILICGNGGSAADSQHFAAELVGRFMTERKGLPAIALTTDTSIITSIGNDYEYDIIFSRQVEALGNKGDMLIGISTSGNSGNVIKAVNLAKEKGMTTVGMLGKDGGKLKEICDDVLLVPCNMTARVQEVQELTYHVICEMIDCEF